MVVETLCLYGSTSVQTLKVGEFAANKTKHIRDLPHNVHLERVSKKRKRRDSAASQTSKYNGKTQRRWCWELVGKEDFTMRNQVRAKLQSPLDLVTWRWQLYGIKHLLKNSAKWAVKVASSQQWWPLRKKLVVDKRTYSHIQFSGTEKASLSVYFISQVERVVLGAWGQGHSPGIQFNQWKAVTGHRCTYG